LSSDGFQPGGGSGADKLEQMLEIMGQMLCFLPSSLG
jgi:hypothetical protein